ncbi:MAG: RNA methyltransferase [Desulfobacterota bacterium]|nr:RNA methyltransferase [Thermodesulfobacteriota bacterium]
MASNLYIGLVHYPVYGKRREVIATAVTSFDIHDISRCARTFGLGGYFIITPLESQIELVQRILRHWDQGEGALYNPTRKESLSLVRVSRSIEEAEEEIYRCHRMRARTVATGAKPYPGAVPFEALKELLKQGEIPYLLLFGTGWGLTQEVKERCDLVLAPIEGKGYNHLSVRSAVAIILDRLLGDRPNPDRASPSGIGPRG